MNIIISIVFNPQHCHMLTNILISETNKLKFRRITLTYETTNKFKLQI